MAPNQKRSQEEDVKQNDCVCSLNSKMMSISKRFSSVRFYFIMFMKSALKMNVLHACVNAASRPQQHGGHVKHFLEGTPVTVTFMFWVALVSYYLCIRPAN